MALVNILNFLALVLNLIITYIVGSTDKVGKTNAEGERRQSESLPP
jgi:hypothetical protein